MAMQNPYLITTICIKLNNLYEFHTNNNPDTYNISVIEKIYKRSFIEVNQKI
jgi:hypothetical protein